MANGTQSFDFGGQGEYIPNSRLQQFKDIINQQNLIMQDKREEYEDKKQSTQFNTNIGLKGIDILKGSRQKKVLDQIKTAGVDPVSGVPLKTSHTQKFVSPLKFTKGEGWKFNVGQDDPTKWSLGKNIKATGHKLYKPDAIATEDYNKIKSEYLDPAAANKGQMFNYSKGSGIFNKGAWGGDKIGGTLGQVGGTALSAYGAAKGIKNWDKLNKAGKAATAVQTLSALNSGLGLLGVATPFGMPLMAAGLITGAAASKSSQNRQFMGGNYGAVGGTASWLGQGMNSGTDFQW